MSDAFVKGPSTTPPGGPMPSGPARPAAGTMSADTERNWAVGAHLSSFAAAYVALGFLGPLTVLLTVGSSSPTVRRHAVEALNFNLTWLLYIAVAGILSIIVIGLPILIALGVAYVVLVVLAAVAASRGEDFRYPLTLRLIS